MRLPPNLCRWSSAAGWREFVNGVFYAIGGLFSGTATVGQPFIYQLTATNHPISYGVVSAPPFAPDVLPADLTIDSTTGIISGIPRTAGRFRTQVTATNASGAGSNYLFLGVFPAPAPDALVIINSNCATGRTSLPFTFQLLTTGGSAATHFSVGGLPPGLTFNAVTGLISGTPTSNGSFAVAVTAIDGAAITHATLQLTFISDPTVPIVTSSGTAIITPGQFFSYTITADVNSTCSYIGTDGVENGALPSGLSFDAPSCTISGTYTGGATGRIAKRTLPALTSVSGQAGDHGTILPRTLTIRPPLIASCQPIVTNSNGTGTAPLNFFQGFSIIVSASPDAAGTVSGGYNNDSSFTATATPNNCYNFVNWTENDVVQSTSPNYTFTPTADRSLVANFTKNSYTISTSGTGGTLNGAGSYDCAASVTVTATPDACHAFVSWTENDVVQSTSPNYQFTVTANRSLVANFNQILYSVTTSAGSGGSAAGDGNFACGSNVTATATANTCYNFVSWTEANVVQSTSSTYTFTPTADRSLVANFAKISYTISTSGTGGTLTGGGSYDCGSTVTVTATPDSCHTFVSWTDNGVVQSTSPSYQFNATADRSLVANFDQISYGVSVSPGAGGSASGSGTFACGSNVTVTATPSAGFNFANWTENASVVSTSPSYSFTIGGNRNLVGNFVAFPTASLSASATTVAKGGTATFTVAGTTMNPSQPIVVSYGVSGNAALGTDYTLSGTPNQITIPPGQSTGNITITVTTAKTGGTEKATITLTSSSGYNLSPISKKSKKNPNQATITIRNR